MRPEATSVCGLKLLVQVTGVLDKLDLAYSRVAQELKAAAQLGNHFNYNQPSIGGHGPLPPQVLALLTFLLQKYKCCLCLRPQ